MRQEYDDTIAYIDKLFDKWKLILHLDYWDIRVHYDQPGAHYWKQFDFEAMMTIEPQWEYLTADVHVNVELTNDADSFKIERTVVHELLHALVNEMGEEGDKHEERVVTELSGILMALEYKEGYA